MKLKQIAGITLSLAMTLSMVGAVHAADDAMMMKAGATSHMYKKGTATWLQIPTASKMHFMYKQKGAWHWQYSIRDMDPRSTSATVGYLDAGKEYVWSVLVKKNDGWMWTPEMPLKTMPM